MDEAFGAIDGDRPVPAEIAASAHGDDDERNDEGIPTAQLAVQSLVRCKARGLAVRVWAMKVGDYNAAVI